MPRYHFNVHDGRTTIDLVGTELADSFAARREAIRTAGQILDGDSKLLALGHDGIMEVTDERGLILFRLDFHLTEAPVLTDLNR